jgi:hypothetical protein
VSQLDVSYLTTDSIQEGVGSSQILPLLSEMAELGLKIGLVTYEKVSPSQELQDFFKKQGVTWNFRSFGSFGASAGLSRFLEMSRNIPEADVVHARSDIPAVAAILADKGPVLWDVRGLWSDQKSFTTHNSIKRQIYKTTRVLEMYSAHNAVSMSTLTRNIVPELESRNRRIPNLRIVVPTSVDLQKFAFSRQIRKPFDGLYSGTYNRYYDLDKSRNFLFEFQKLHKSQVSWARPLESPQTSLLAGESKMFTVPQSDMSSIIPEFAYGLAICDETAGASLKGAVPTKIAEFLACGRPVVVNQGLGDFDELFSDFAAGVIIPRNKAELRTSAMKLLELLNDPETPYRCRELAEKHFSLKNGVKEYLSLYQKMQS